MSPSLAKILSMLALLPKALQRVQKPEELLESPSSCLLLSELRLHYFKCQSSRRVEKPSLHLDLQRQLRQGMLLVSVADVVGLNGYVIWEFQTFYEEDLFQHNSFLATWDSPFSSHLQDTFLAKAATMSSGSLLAKNVTTAIINDPFTSVFSFPRICMLHAFLATLVQVKCLLQEACFLPHLEPSILLWSSLMTFAQLICLLKRE